MDRLPVVILAVSMTLALAAPQLRLEPERIAVGETLVVRAEYAGATLADTGIEVELPDGSTRDIGTTDSNGSLPFVPETPGQHVFRTEVQGVRMVAPCIVVPARSRWLTAAVCVPLGLALLWRNLSRSRDRRGQ